MLSRRHIYMQCRFPCQSSIYIQYNQRFPVKNRHDLLGGLFNVTSLELIHFETLAMLNKSSDIFPVFPNMRTLSLERCFLGDECAMDSRLDDLGSFLENTPCLEKLTLRCCMVHPFYLCGLPCLLLFAYASYLSLVLFLKVLRGS
uniref:Uncharacterized protein n=1 Tax=Arundo donax TaxID=35708 RepID=A0A0A9CXA5_ARUDO